MTVSGSIVEAWRERVAAGPGRAAIRYFDGAIDTAALDSLTDALAAELQARGVRSGDRIGIYLQNIPYYPLSLLAVWKAGAIAVPLNPMYRGEELRRLVEDSGTTGIIVARGTDEATRNALVGTPVRWLLSASSRDFQTRNDPRVFTEPDPAPSPDGDLTTVLAARRGQRPTRIMHDGDDIAFITYTSGTTGPPKGALNTHRNFLCAVAGYAEWIRFAAGDVSYAIAPMFHITGLSLNAGIALMSDATLSMSGRFEASVALDTIREHEVTTTVGSITAFNAFFGVPDAGTDHFASAKRIYSGGAPIPPATIDAFRDRFGVYLHNIWGMTETTGGGIAVPPGVAAPVHSPSGTLSVGVATRGVEVVTVDAQGRAQPPGQEGELVVTAPQVIPGYWQNEEATERTLPGGHLHTGDVAIIDDEGWVYLVDRIKDQINTSGYKVWPREVEDVLYEHPSVLEVAVVGVPDEYRGEAVVAYVSLREGETTDPAELVAFAGERLAAYKRPREVHVLEALPKTATGKIQRGALRGR
ncbi:MULTISPECIES: AMP-binding protein [unclassified Rhodococcus (in: high G+C Gram-positive bacteria)]|uniref:class I adenylate-forming enzyme family protein n=1 Tax=Rhodococcus sp. SJ-3 TaxID=3454628 RepID=UPI003F7A98C7